MSKRRRLVAFRGLRSAPNRESGFSLIEILVALGILAAVAVVFLLGITTSSKAVMVSQEAVATESLAKSELEYVKSVLYTELPFDPVSDPLWEYQVPGNTPWDTVRDLPDGYAGYSVEVSGYSVGSVGVYPPGEIQKITVTVTHDEKVFTLVGYKVK